MRRRAALHAVLLLAALPWLVQCGAARRARPVLPPPATSASGATGVAAGEAPRLVPDRALQELLDPYPAQQGPSWLGGDVATSIRLGDDRWVWIFGDTLLGSIRDRCADGRPYCDRRVTDGDGGMISNSAGTMFRGADGTLWPVVKYWRTDASGAPAPLFTAPGDGFLWPLAGVRVGTVLLVAANRHTFASGLSPTGNVLVRVWNPDAPPDAWLYDVHELDGFRAATDAAPTLSWTTALVPHGDGLYVVGSRDAGPHAQTVLAWLDARGVADRAWRPVLEYLHDDADRSPVWDAALDPARLHVIEGLPGTSEATVDAAPGVGWYTFQVPALHYEIRLYTADDLLGPWIDRGVAYALPEAWLATKGHCPDPQRVRAEANGGPVPPECEPRFAAYAAKAHPELARQGFAVTYNVNTWGGGYEAAVHALETMPGFYVPQVVATPE
ncbi:MAG: hypothetical protein U0842_04765 [Candidatus Binatia bacterium]